MPEVTVSPFIATGGEVDVAAWKGPGDEPPGEISAEAAVGWWEDGLYVYIDVTDPFRFPAPEDTDTWCGAGVEIYIDDSGEFENPPDYDDPGTRQFVMVAPESDDEPASRGEVFSSDGRLGDWDGTFAAQPRDGGYIAEAIVSAGDLGLENWPLAGGQRVGLNLAINVSTEDGSPPDDDPCDGGVRLGQYFHRVDPDDDSSCGGHPYCNVRAFCTPTLAEP